MHIAAALATCVPKLIRIVGPILWGHSGPLCCRCSCRRCHRCAGGVRHWRHLVNGNVKRLSVANGPNIFQMLFVISCRPSLLLNSTEEDEWSMELENCPRLRLELPPTAFRTETLTPLTSDVDLQSSEGYGHDPYTCKRSKSKVTRFES